MSNHSLNKYLSVILFIERYGDIHILRGRNKKTSVLRTRFFQLILNASDVL